MRGGLAEGLGCQRLCAGGSQVFCSCGVVACSPCHSTLDHPGTSVHARCMRALSIPAPGATTCMLGAVQQSQCVDVHVRGAIAVAGASQVFRPPSACAVAPVTCTHVCFAHCRRDLGKFAACHAAVHKQFTVLRRPASCRSMLRTHACPNFAVRGVLLLGSSWVSCVADLFHGGPVGPVSACSFSHALVVGVRLAAAAA